MDLLPTENNQLSVQTESLPDNSNGNSAPNQLATGPRTELGKQRASHNATKYGIFSKVIVLKGESSIEYEELLVGLVEALQPCGALEELFVEKLATTQWRLRRLFLAEGAEIRKNREFFEWDQQKPECKEADEPQAPKIGLIEKVNDPVALRRCLEKLSILRGQVEKKGLQPGYDVVLNEIYGFRDPERGPADWNTDVYTTYRKSLWFACATEEGRKRGGYPPPEHYQKIMLQEINKEILRVQGVQNERAATTAEYTELVALSRSVPDAVGLDRLLRYETSLERSFERTLSQLERLQRIRRGQPVLPEAKVRITTDA